MSRKAGTLVLSAGSQDVRFCRAPDGVRIAYAVHGSGPPLVVNTCWLSHLQHDWQSPVWRHFVDELGQIATVIRYDERGYGLSDWDVADLSFEARITDLEAVVDAAGLDRFALLGMSQGGPVAIAYVVRHRDRVTRLVLHNAHTTPARTSDDAEMLDTFVQLIRVAGRTAHRAGGRRAPAGRRRLGQCRDRQRPHVERPDRRAPPVERVPQAGSDREDGPGSRGGASAEPLTYAHAATSPRMRSSRLRVGTDSSHPRPALVSLLPPATGSVVGANRKGHAMTSNVLEETVAKFRADPSAAQTAPAVTASLANGRARLSGGPFNWESDLPPVIGGGNVAPSPTAYLLGALAGCAVAFIHDTLAPQLGVTVTDVSAVARCRADLGGLLGLDGSDPRLEGLAIEITIESSDTPERVEELRQAWLERCPVFLALRDAAPVDVAWASS